MEAVISTVGSILGSLAGKASAYTVDPIAQQLSYLFKHRSKVQNLRDELRDLKEARERVQQYVHEASRNGEEIFGDVDRWLTEVNGKFSDQAATQLEEDEEKAKKRCLVGLCPNFKSRYQLSKKAEKEANAIAELLKKKDGFDGVSHRPALEGMSTKPVKDYKFFESRSGALNGVMKALEDDNFYIIGVYGMGGVGKTTLVQEVARQANEKQMFDEVVLVAVTQTPKTVDIQNEIADKLGLRFDETSNDMRAARLHDRLKKEKMVLIILDDIWVKLDLQALGIPSRGEHHGCKILITSRKLDVLKSMDSRKNLAIDILKEDEAWNLFKSMAGHIVERSDLQSIAIEVSQKCAGLPIAIATVAKVLKHKENLFEWQNALEQLKRPSEGDVYSAIELSYTFLKAKELQLTFLLCSIMGHNAAVEDLLKYGRGLGLFRGLNTIEKVRNKVSTLVKDLKDSSLLLDSSSTSDSECFDMHDVVRDVAISIASRDHHWLALGREDVFEEWSDEETMRNCNLLSLQYAEVSELPDELECPNLTFFSMGSEEDCSLKIPNNFFKGMQRLKVLKFSKMQFSFLPSSIVFLKNIHTLCFSRCTLDDIIIIGELTNLEILSLRGSKIARLPREIGQLTKLKLLDLSYCYNLKVISPDVLSNLSRLEELYLYGSFDRWELVEGHDHDHPIRSNASLVELQHLSHLTTLEVHIPNEQAIPKDNSFLEKLERYKISIGMNLDFWFHKLGASRMLKLENDKSFYLYDWVKTLLRKADDLHMNRVKDIEDMLYDPNTEGLSHLKHLYVCKVSKIKYLSNPMKLVPFKAFPLLESLSLDSLISLEAISYGELKAESFGRLRVIKIYNCMMLKNLFSVSVARELRQLQQIDLSDCNNIREIIGEYKEEEEEIGTNEVTEIVEFSQLRYLRLEKLESFIGFMYCGKKLSSSQQGRLQSIDAGSDATSLFDQKVVFPGIKVLELFFMPIKKLWHDQLPATKSSVVQNITTLTVKRCHKLKYVFTSSMVNSFVQLKRLIIEDCDKMEEVIVEDAERSSSRMVFSKLGYLELRLLSNLKTFCSANIPIEFPILKEITMNHCPVLNTFHYDSTSAGNEARTKSISMDHNLRIHVPPYLFNEKVALPMLEQLEISCMKNLERIWANQLAEESFGKLIYFRLEKCDKLLNVFPLSMMRRLQRLNKLTICYCELLEEIFESQQGSTSAIESLSPKLIQLAVLAFEFPQVTYLELFGLPKLKSLYYKIHTANWPSLKEMRVEDCDKVEILFSSQETSGKGQHEVPIQQPLFWVNKVALPMLEHLNISRMANLESIWANQLAEESFGKLIYFHLEKCDKLLNVFPLSMMRSFQRLNKLTIRYCELLEEIFESQQGSTSAIESLSPKLLQSALLKFEFPQVTYFELLGLPKLKSLYYKMHTANWPSLKAMRMEDCDKVEILFASQETSGKGQHEIPIKQPLFWVNKFTFPNLQEVALERNVGMKEIWHGYGQQLASDYFCNLRVIRLEWYPKELAIFPSEYFRFLSLPNLEKLEIREAYFKEIFQSLGVVGGEENPASAWVVHSRLTELRLENLRELRQLWKEKTGFQNLRILHVKFCPKLWGNLVSSSVSFQNLATLEVEHCHGIKNLVTHSTAKSLVQLKEMKINCTTMPKHEGESQTPFFHKLQFKKGVDEVVWNWEGSLIGTNCIQQLFQEQNNMVEDEEYENYEEDEGNPSTSNTQNLVEDQGNSSTSNTNEYLTLLHNPVKGSR